MVPERHANSERQKFSQKLSRAYNVPSGSVLSQTRFKDKLIFVSHHFRFEFLCACDLWCAVLHLTSARKCSTVGPVCRAQARVIPSWAAEAMRIGDSETKGGQRTEGREVVLQVWFRITQPQVHRFPCSSLASHANAIYACFLMDECSHEQANHLTCQRNSTTCDRAHAIACQENPACFDWLELVLLLVL